MNDPISISDRLLERGRHLAKIGRTAEAGRSLHAFLARPDGTAPDRADANRLLGDLAFDLGGFRKARRHYAVAIGLRPDDAETYLAYAQAVDADPDADPRKGWVARRRATRIDPFEPRGWSALGQSALRIGKLGAARKAFRRAAELRPDGIDTLAEVVAGFVTLGRIDEARAVLTAARFRSPRDAKLAALWNRFQFDCLHREQRRSANPSDEPVVLPFPGRPVETKTPAIVRADRRSTVVPHVLRLFGSRPDSRRANEER